MVKYASRFCIVCILGTILFGCTTTPNLPYQGSGYPSSFSQLSLDNDLLAKELGKLPEIQDGISMKEARALDTMVKLYQKDPDVFDSAFKQMYQIGLPEVRKYCPPLQAIFWLAEDDELDRDSNPLVDYSLKKLLDKAWKFDGSVRLSEDQITDILNGIKDRNKREDYSARRKRLPTSRFQAVIIAAYREGRYSFTREARKIIESLRDPRWADFRVVVDRLSAPELIDYYIDRTFHYRHVRTPPHPPRVTFSRKWGDCDDLAAFGLYVLGRGGYRTFGRCVLWTADNRGHVGVGIKLRDGRYLLVVDFDQHGNLMSGPYTDISEADKILSRGRIFHTREWWRP